MASKPVYVKYVVLPDATILKKEGFLVRVELVQEDRRFANGDNRS